MTIVFVPNDNYYSVWSFWFARCSVADYTFFFAIT